MFASIALAVVILFCLVILNMVLATDTTPPTIIWEDPTPPDGNITANNYVYVNVSVNDTETPNNLTAFIDWNRSLVGWWRFNNETGENSTFFIDWSSWVNNGTCSSTTCPNFTSEGKFGGAYVFDGSNDYINLSNPSSFPNGILARTMCAWAKTNTVAAGTRWIASYGKATTSQAMSIGMVGTTLYGSGYSDTITYSNFWSTDVWNHICLVYNGTYASLYTNGLMVNSTAKTWNLVRDKAYIGRLVTGNEYWNGTIDEVSIFNHTLSAQEINASYNAGLYRLEKNFTNLTDSTYNYTAYVQDLAGNMNSTSRGVIVDLAPVASFGTNPVDNYNSNSSSITFDLKCSDNIAVHTIQLWTNTTGVWQANYSNSSYANNTWINITVNGIPDGTNHKWAVWCNDSAGNSNITNNRTFNVDTHNPEISLIEPESDQEFSSGTESITFSWDVTDNIDTNISCNVYTKDSYQEIIYCENDITCEQTISGFSAGDYTWEVNCSDGINQNVSDSRDFNIASGGGGGGGGGGTPQNITNATNNTEPLGYNYNLGDLNGQSKSAGVGLNEILKFGITSGDHMLKVIALTNNSVTLTIWSNPIQVAINKGETKQLDLNGNGNNDLEIIFTNISEGKANLVLKELVEQISSCGDNLCSVNEKEECCTDCGCQTGYTCNNNKCELINSKGNTKSWTWIIALIVVIALIVYFIVSKTARKRRGY